MKYTLLLLAIFLLSPETTAQSTTWAGYYREFTPADDFLQTFKFPEPSNRQKLYRELLPKERRLVKSHLRVHYGVRPTNKGYLWGAVQGTGQTLGRLFVCIGVMSLAAIVEGVLTNQSPR